MSYMIVEQLIDGDGLMRVIFHPFPPQGHQNTNGSSNPHHFFTKKIKKFGESELISDIKKSLVLNKDIQINFKF